MWAEIEPNYIALTTAAEEMLIPFSANTADAIGKIAQNEDDFLQEMNAIVNQYELEAADRVQRLQRIQQALMVLTLLSLLPVLIPIRQLIRQVNTLIFTMQQSGIQVQSSPLQIAASENRLEATVTEQSAISAQITDSSRQIVVTAHDLMSHVEQVLEKAQAAKNGASEREQELTNRAATMAQLEGMNQSIANRLGTISDRTHTID